MASVTDPDGDEHSSVTITLGFAEFEVCGAFSGSSMEASGSSSASLGADDDCFAKSFPSPVKQELLTIRDLGVLNSVSPAASACHQHISHVFLSMHSVIESQWRALRARTNEMRS
jgi:hypothetical protein